jgi:NOL1/NOP2/fmu family ribosome biogenesis protein
MDELDGESCRLQLEEDWNIVETPGGRGGYGYRFFPDRLKGEGFFLAAVRKKEGGRFDYPRSKKPTLEKLSRPEMQQVQTWVGKDQPLTFFRHHEDVYALPEMLTEDLVYLQGTAYLKKAGVIMGKLAGVAFIPEHDLALSAIVSRDLPSVDISKEQAIQYLRKEELRLDGAPTGWTLVRYEGQNLGWVKILPNRVNNYYPKEWRILKRDP